MFPQSSVATGVDNGQACSSSVCGPTSISISESPDESSPCSSFNPLGHRSRATIAGRSRRPLLGKVTTCDAAELRLCILRNQTSSIVYSDSHLHTLTGFILISWQQVSRLKRKCHPPPSQLIARVRT